MSGYVDGLRFIKIFHNKGKHHIRAYSNGGYHHGVLVLTKDTDDTEPKWYGCMAYSSAVLSTGWCNWCCDMPHPCRLLQEQHVAAARLKGEI